MAQQADKNPTGEQVCQQPWLTSSVSAPHHTPCHRWPQIHDMVWQKVKRFLHEDKMEEISADKPPYTIRLVKRIDLKSFNPKDAITVESTNEEVPIKKDYVLVADWDQEAHEKYFDLSRTSVSADAGLCPLHVASKDGNAGLRGY